MIASVPGVERPFAVAHAGNDGAPGLLAQNVAVRAAGPLEGIFDCLGEAHGNAAEEAVACVLNLLDAEGAASICLLRGIGLAAGWGGVSLSCGKRSIRRWLVGCARSTRICRRWQLLGVLRMWRDLHWVIVGLGGV